MGPRQRIVVVDAFTNRMFAGNPAAVCVMTREADEPLMRAIAREMNLSETAFLYPEGRDWHLRWFTPAAEVELCGHATLASAHVLWAEHGVTTQQVGFHTKSGLLTAERVTLADAEGRERAGIELDFPARAVEETPLPGGLVKALGFPLKDLKGCFRFNDDFLLEVSTPKLVQRLTPNFSALKEVYGATGPVRAVIVTARAEGEHLEGGYDIVSRFFGPGVGIDEDPVTGSAHCMLGPYWAKRLGKDVLNAHQASARGGDLLVKVLGTRVKLAGEALTVMRGELALPQI